MSRDCRTCGQSIDRKHTCAGTPKPEPRPHRRPDQRADQRQRDSVRSELHAIVDRLIDAWPALERHARTMTRGYPSTGLAAHGGTAELTTVERLADAHLFNHEADPAADAHLALDALDQLRHDARHLDGRVQQLLPRPTTHRMRPTDDADSESEPVDDCADCGDPIPRGQLRRIDGQPYHATSCFFRVWRSLRSA